MRDKSITLRLPNEMREWLFKKSEKDNKSPSQIIRELIENKMKI